MLKSHALYFLGAGLFLSYSMSVYALPQEQFLQQQTMSVTQNTQFCRQIPAFCSENKASFYQVKGHPEQLYAINDLKLAEIRQQADQFSIVQQWDFSTYQPRTQAARWASFDRGDEKHLSIFPKLFPINEKNYAVGIVQSWQEGYSGGGMSEEVVDFVELKANGTYQQVFQNIPLSMYRMIRACFSEEDYTGSDGVCHDEYTLDSQIVYVKPYTWQVKYHYQADFSPASASGTKPINLRQSYLLKDNRADAIILPKAWE